MRRLRTWFFDALLLSAAIVIAVVIGEVGLRLFYPQPMGVWHQDREGLAIHWPRLVTYLPQFGLSVSFNSVGMRDREHRLDKPTGVVRVLVLGDSFMEALQVPFEASFPSLLERQLAQSTAKRVEVINASVSGWGTDDELTYLTNYGMQWRPDLILVAMTLHNDISDNLRERFHTIWKGRLIDKPEETASFFEYGLVQLKGFLATRSHVYQLVIRAKRAPEERAEGKALNAHVVKLFTEPSDENISRGLQLTSVLLERMKAIAEEKESRLVVVLLPLAMQVSDERFAKFATSALALPQTMRIDKPQRLMKSVGDRLGIEMIDLLGSFRQWAAAGGAALYLEHDGHWTEAGHRLAAGVVASDLVRFGLIRDTEKLTASAPRREQ